MPSILRLKPRLRHKLRLPSRPPPRSRLRPSKAHLPRAGLAPSCLRSTAPQSRTSTCLHHSPTRTNTRSSSTSTPIRLSQSRPSVWRSSSWTTQSRSLRRTTRLTRAVSWPTLTKSWKIIKMHLTTRRTSRNSKWTSTMSASASIANLMSRPLCATCSSFTATSSLTWHRCRTSASKSSALHLKCCNRPTPGPVQRLALTERGEST
mmetsp:Transcript_11000/g.14887  ORF Transcript_11000/g.14887 Transcript_11000/m.14887 type:complete len:206 (-) Transcript_11000:234-851(-)